MISILEALNTTKPLTTISTSPQYTASAANHTTPQNLGRITGYTGRDAGEKQVDQRRQLQSPYVPKPKVNRFGPPPKNLFRASALPSYPRN